MKLLRIFFHTIIYIIIRRVYLLDTQLRYSGKYDKMINKSYEINLVLIRSTCEI